MGNEKPKVIYYHLLFMYKVFHYNNFLAYLSQDNKLILFEFQDNKVIRYKIPNILVTNSQVGITSEEIAKDKINIIFKKLKEMKNNLNEDYEVLIDILDNDMNEHFLVEKPIKFSGKAEFEIDKNKIHFTCTIGIINYQIDEISIIREQIDLEKGKNFF